MRTPSPLLGCAIGDSLGKPFENYKNPKQPKDIDWDDFSFLPGQYDPDPRVSPRAQVLMNQAGVPTDDTQLSRILAFCLQGNGFDREILWRQYLEWYRGGSFVGEPRGMGGTIAASFERGVKGLLPGILLPSDKTCGTGPAMRSGVLGMLPLPLQDIPRFAKSDAGLTHIHPDAESGSVSMAVAVYHALHSPKMADVGLRMLPTYVRATLCQCGMGNGPMAWALRMVESMVQNYDCKTPDFQFLGVGDDIVGCTATAIYCAATATSFRDGVVRAIRLGLDTDTRAAMTGTILGTRVGREGIPKDWVSGVYESEEIQQEDRKLVILSGVKGT